MTNREKLPEGCWVTAFSSSLPPRAAGTGLHVDSTPARHRHLAVAVSQPMTDNVGAGPRAMRAAAVATDDAVPVRRRGRSMHPVMTRELFADALLRERKRADRFEQPFTLVVIEMAHGARGGTVDPLGSALWRSVIDVMTGVSDHTAVLGWLESQRWLGAILPYAGGVDPVPALQRELVSVVGAEGAALCTIGSSVYAPITARLAQPDGDALVLDGGSSRDGRVPATYGIKRPLDLVGSLALLMVTWPLFIVIAVLVKLTSPGPVLFRQGRVGQMARPFTMLKFRTMRVGADPALHREFVTRFIKSGGRESLNSQGPYKLTNDPRVTRLGRILRKTSLDELPQLWNVLHGEMSLVGPRPPLALEVEQYRPWHWRRVLDAKPGLTGLWQVTGRSRTTFDEMARLDLRYVKACALWTDIKILLATPRAVITGNGAR